MTCTVSMYPIKSNTNHGINRTGRGIISKPIAKSEKAITIAIIPIINVDIEIGRASCRERV